MTRVGTEKSLSKILAYGMAAIIVFLINGSVSDPVNVTKLFLLGAVAFASFGYILKYWKEWFIRANFLTISFISAFILISIYVLFQGDAPFQQDFYGSYGRNNGFLTYFCLALIFLTSSLLREMNSFRHLINGLLFAGVVNLIYCGWVLLFGDPMSWKNPYNNILGTLGNPNFIGAFLGILAPTFLCFSMLPKIRRFQRGMFLIAIPVALIEAFFSHAIQGRIVAIFGFSIIAFFLIRSRSILFSWLYVAIVMVVGYLAVLGALQRGPLADLIYKTSVSLRGQYWLAAFNTGKSHFWTGVGFDAFGDWYRRMRDAKALILPGPNTTVNAAHNIPLDLFAFGGILLLVAYVCLIVLVLISIIKVSKRDRKFEPVFVAMVVIWAGYQLQSIISINQIGLAVIGWVFGGAIIAYDHATRISILASDTDDKSIKVKSRRSSRPETVNPGVLAGIGMIVGAMIAVPPLSADMRWRSAMVNNSFSELQKALQPSYLSPQNTMMYGVAIDSMERSKIYDYAHEYTIAALEFNKDSFDLWRLLYVLTNSTMEEKAEALQNMRRLDPLVKDPLK